jgi:hypothetical protein
VVFENFALDPNDSHFLSDLFSEAINRIAESLFRGKSYITTAIREPIVAGLHDIQINYFRDAFSTFVCNLDGDAIAAIRASGLRLSVARYNAYRRGDRGAHYRIQAAKTIPLLSYLIDEESDSANQHLLRLVDSGQPLWPALSDALGVPMETVRWLRGKTFDEVGNAWFGRIPELLRSLSHVSPDKRPIRPDEWNAFTDFALALALPEEYSWLYDDAQRARWRNDISRIGWITAREKFEAIGAAPTDLIDINDLIAEIVTVIKGEIVRDTPAHHRSIDPQWKELKKEIESQFLESSTLKQLRASLRWHALQLMPADGYVEPLEDTSQPDPKLRPDRWPAPVAEPIALDGVFAHFLTTQGQLENEGLRMRHCVGNYNYTHKCLYNGASIVSLRDGDGQSLSTAELRLGTCGTKLYLSIVQHRARNNTAPAQLAVNALTQLLAKLNVDSMQPRFLEMQIKHKERQSMEDIRSQWQVDAPVTAHRLKCLALALKEHIGWDRFLEIGKNHLASNLAKSDAHSSRISITAPTK